MSVDILTRSGKHVWVEITSGTPQANRESYYCIKCGQRAAEGWTGPGPENSVCVRGDKVIDTGILHRQPEKPWWVKPDPFTLFPPPPIPFPSFLWGVDMAQGGFQPLLFHPTRPGFLVVISPSDAERTCTLLADQGFRLQAKDAIALQRNPQQVREALMARALSCPSRIYGAYWGLTPQGDAVAFHFSPFDETPRGVA